MITNYQDRFGREVIDNGDGTFSADGITVQPMLGTIEDAINVFDGMIPEVWVEPRKPLDRVGALATLLAVTETLTVEDAANAVGLAPEDLIAEAEAWAVAQGDN